MKKQYSTSFLTLILCGVFIFFYRISNVNVNEISWDVLGYYLYLPATFIYNDFFLSNISWLQELNADKHLSGTLYMISQNKDGEPMYFFLMGMSFFYLPFFLIGTLIAYFNGFPTDGFSLPYQYSLVLGGIIYTIIGLVFLRKILRLYFPEKLTTLVILIIVFGTNYIHHMTLKNIETVNVIFMLVSIILWYTIKWHEKQKAKYLIIIGVSISFLILVKPSEIFIILLFLFWNVDSIKTLKEKYILLISKKRSVLIAIGVSVLPLIPQMAYWYIKSGYIIYDSYKNPGVGLDIFSPHILNSLFSYRKGWLLYTPVMIFAIIGFFFLYKNNKKQFFSLFFYFIISFYVISSWSEWWYGAGFSNRPIIAIYPVLAISMGYFFNDIRSKSKTLKVFVFCLTLFFIFLNQFQWWQLKNYILDPYRTTKDYYWAVFLKTSITEANRDLLLIERDFSGKKVFTQKEKYEGNMVKTENFQTENNPNIIFEGDSNIFFRILANLEFYSIYEKQIGEITSKDHIWITVSFDIKFPENFTGQTPLLIITMDHKGGAYGYSAYEIKTDGHLNEWKKIDADYLTPDPMRNEGDRIKCYIWNRSKISIDVDNIQIKLYEKR